MFCGTVKVISFLFAFHGTVTYFIKLDNCISGQELGRLLNSLQLGPDSMLD
jgi:hypothetical protein